MLEAALGEELTQQYMTQCMFDDDPSDDPPYFDGSVAKLYRWAGARPAAALHALQEVGMLLAVLPSVPIVSCQH